MIFSLQLKGQILGMSHKVIYESIMFLKPIGSNPKMVTWYIVIQKNLFVIRYTKSLKNWKWQNRA